MMKILTQKMLGAQGLGQNSVPLVLRLTANRPCQP